MNSSFTTYMDIRSEVIGLWAKSDFKDYALIQLKNSYKDTINSMRRMEYLDSPSALIDILEKRGCLSVSNLQPLKDVCGLLKSSLQIISKIKTYEANLLSSTRNGQQHLYAAIVNSRPSINTPLPIQPKSTQDDRSKRQTHVYKMLCMEIGSSWRNVARHLSIPEGAIDNIDCTYENNLKSKISDILLLFEAKTHPILWMETLCAALEKSRRNDLRCKKYLHNEARPQLTLVDPSRNDVFGIEYMNIYKFTLFFIM